ncbi:MAG: flagellar basal body P-ring protein FlgI, partial [Anaerolineae bacterium]|nr:flagellar basal body P-ring protein FlgI [Phycisphaerae bacterium]
MPSATTSLIRPLGSARIVTCHLLVASMIFFIVGCPNNNKPKPAPPRYSTLPPRADLPPFMKDTIYERIELMNTEALNVNNFGVVVLVQPTGDGQNAPLAVKDYVIREMIKKGIGSKNGNSPAEQMTPSEMLKDPRVAIVRVDGMIPAGARKGQQFDVAVSALDVGQNNTSSLAGGTLYRADLFINGANPRDPGKVIDVQGVCQGDIFVNPEYALRDPNDP